MRCDLATVLLTHHFTLFQPLLSVAVSDEIQNKTSFQDLWFFSPFITLCDIRLFVLIKWRNWLMDYLCCKYICQTIWDCYVVTTCYCSWNIKYFWHWKHISITRSKASPWLDSCQNFLRFSCQIKIRHQRSFFDLLNLTFKAHLGKKNDSKLLRIKDPI